MGFGFGKVVGRSILKALKQTGITIGAVGATAVGLALANPEALTPLLAVVGPFAPLVLIAASVGGQAVVDAVKHRDKMKPQGPGGEDQVQPRMSRSPASSYMDVSPK